MNITIQAIKETDESKRKIIAQQAYFITQEANFPTDHQDVYDHLFEGSEKNLDFLALLNDNDDLLGFASFVICEGNILYVKGIVVSPLLQGEGFSKLLLEEAIKIFLPDWVALRTHNPRMYETVTSFSEEFYPTVNEKVPEDIHNMLFVLPFDFTQIKIEPNMIIKNCYPDVKIQQKTRKSNSTNLFHTLGEKDAQVVLVKL